MWTLLVSIAWAGALADLGHASSVASADCPEGKAPPRQWCRRPVPDGRPYAALFTNMGLFDEPQAALVYDWEQLGLAGDLRGQLRHLRLGPPSPPAYLSQGEEGFPDSAGLVWQWYVGSDFVRVTVSGHPTPHVAVVSTGTVGRIQRLENWKAVRTVLTHEQDRKLVHQAAATLLVMPGVAGSVRKQAVLIAAGPLPDAEVLQGETDAFRASSGPCDEAYTGWRSALDLHRSDVEPVRRSLFDRVVEHASTCDLAREWLTSLDDDTLSLERALEIHAALGGDSAVESLLVLPAQRRATATLLDRGLSGTAAGIGRQVSMGLHDAIWNQGEDDRHLAEHLPVDALRASADQFRPQSPFHRAMRSLLSAPGPWPSEDAPQVELVSDGVRDLEARVRTRGADAIRVGETVKASDVGLEPDLSHERYVLRQRIQQVQAALERNGTPTVTWDAQVLRDGSIQKSADLSEVRAQDALFEELVALRKLEPELWAAEAAAQEATVTKYRYVAGEKRTVRVSLREDGWYVVGDQRRPVWRETTEEREWTMRADQELDHEVALESARRKGKERIQSVLWDGGAAAMQSLVRERLASWLPGEAERRGWSQAEADTELQWLRYWNGLGPLPE